MEKFVKQQAKIVYQRDMLCNIEKHKTYIRLFTYIQYIVYSTIYVYTSRLLNY